MITAGSYRLNTCSLPAARGCGCSQRTAPAPRDRRSRLREVSPLPRQPIHSILAGTHARGRGDGDSTLKSSENTPPGDDVRTIDWHVTARTRKPYVRVYGEERDRPLPLVVDQRQRCSSQPAGHEVGPRRPKRRHSPPGGHCNRGPRRRDQRHATANRGSRSRRIGVKAVSSACCPRSSVRTTL